MREECPTARKKRRKLPPEFKAEGARLCKVGDRSIGQVAADLDPTETALREWVRRADIDAGQGPPGALTTAEREELQRLRRENKRLQMERDIKSSGHLLREGERVKFAFVREKQVAFPGSAMCRAVGISSSGYYEWRKRLPGPGPRTMPT